MRGAGDVATAQTWFNGRRLAMNQPEMDQELLYLPSPDWWSRLLAIGSLMVAGAALYWSYLQYEGQRPQAEDRMAQIQTLVTDGMRAIEEKADQERQRIDSYVNTVLRPTGEPPLTSDERASQERQGVERTSLEEPIDGPHYPPTDSSGDRTAGSSPSGDPPRTLDLSATPAAGPDLIVTGAVLLADDMAYQPTLVIRNRGDAAARITRIRLDPTADFGDVPLEVAEHDFGITTKDRLVINFLPEDNRSHVAGQHGSYICDVEPPFVIEPDQQVDIQVLLRNSRHAQYGLRGRILLQGNEGDVLSYNGAAIPFVRMRLDARE